MRYSLLNVIVNGLTGNRFTGPAWRDPAPKPAYDVVIVGGGVAAAGASAPARRAVHAAAPGRYLGAAAAEIPPSPV